MSSGAMVLESALKAKAGASLGRWKPCSAHQGERQPALHKFGAGRRRSLAPAGGWLSGAYGGVRPQEREVTICKFFLTRWVPFTWPQVVPYCMSTHNLPCSHSL
jgi:hypothetical protein